MRTYKTFRHYMWIIEVLKSRGPITLKEFNRVWENSSLSGGQPMARSSFNWYREQIESMFGIRILCDHRTYGYYIPRTRNILRNDLQEWLSGTLTISTALSESMALHDRILLEEVPTGGAMLEEIMQGMRENRRLRVSYLKFGATKPQEFTGIPFALKLFHQRWYALMRTPRHPDLAVYALDRMQEVNITDESFSIPEDWDAKAYFRDSFGVYAGEDFPVHQVLLRVYGRSRDYLRSLPLHPSQREESNNDEFALFSLRIRPTYDFLQELLSLGSQVEVLQPLSLRQQIHDEIQKLSAMYQDK